MFWNTAGNNSNTNRTRSGFIYGKSFMYIVASLAIIGVAYFVRERNRDLRLEGHGNHANGSSNSQNLIDSFNSVDLIFELSGKGIFGKGKDIRINGLSLSAMQIYLTVMMSYEQLTTENKNLSLIGYRSYEGSIVTRSEDEANGKWSLDRNLNLRFLDSNRVLREMKPRKNLFKFKCIDPDSLTYRYEYKGDAGDNCQTIDHLEWMIDRINIIGKVNGFENDGSFEPLIETLQTILMLCEESLSQDGNILEE